jgi:hypothetical protein
MVDRRCKDCVTQGVTTVRPAPYSGPRCATHDRERKKAKSAEAHANRIGKMFGLSEDDYWALYEFQRCEVEAAGGTGVDPIDQRSTGVRKRLAVDHDHVTGEVRGLLAGSTNFELLGRYSREALVRAIAYLDDPPARRFFGEPRYIPVEGE